MLLRILLRQPEPPDLGVVGHGFVLKVMAASAFAAPLIRTLRLWRDARPFWVVTCGNTLITLNIKTVDQTT